MINDRNICDIWLKYMWYIIRIYMIYDRNTYDIWLKCTWYMIAMYRIYDKNPEQVLAATPHKTPTVRPPAPYHENYSS